MINEAYAAQQQEDREAVMLDRIEWLRKDRNKWRALAEREHELRTNCNHKCTCLQDAAIDE